VPEELLGHSLLAPATSDYSTKTFDDLCESKDFSLKPQQKFAARVMNTHVDNKGLLVYHGL
jgi:hypothetical protein